MFIHIRIGTQFLGRVCAIGGQAIETRFFIICLPLVPVGSVLTLPDGKCIELEGPHLLSTCAGYVRGWGFIGAFTFLMFAWITGRDAVGTLGGQDASGGYLMAGLGCALLLAATVVAGRLGPAARRERAALLAATGLSVPPDHLPYALREHVRGELCKALASAHGQRVHPDLRYAADLYGAHAPEGDRAWSPTAWAPVPVHPEAPPATRPMLAWLLVAGAALLLVGPPLVHAVASWSAASASSAEAARRALPESRAHEAASRLDQGAVAESLDLMHAALGLETEEDRRMKRFNEAFPDHQRPHATPLAPELAAPLRAAYAAVLTRDFAKLRVTSAEDESALPALAAAVGEFGDPALQEAWRRDLAELGRARAGWVVTYSDQDSLASLEPWKELRAQVRGLLTARLGGSRQLSPASAAVLGPQAVLGRIDLAIRCVDDRYSGRDFGVPRMLIATLRVHSARGPTAWDGIRRFTATVQNPPELTAAGIAGRRRTAFTTLSADLLARLDALAALPEPAGPAPTPAANSAIDLDMTIAADPTAPGQPLLTVQRDWLRAMVATAVQDRFGRVVNAAPDSAATGHVHATVAMACAPATSAQHGLAELRTPIGLSLTFSGDPGDAAVPAPVVVAAEPVAEGEAISAMADAWEQVLFEAGRQLAGSGAAPVAAVANP